MIVNVEIPLEGRLSVTFPREPGREEVPDAFFRKQAPNGEVRDPAAFGEIGRVLSAGVHRRDGKDWLTFSLEIDDVAAVAATSRSGGAF